MARSNQKILYPSRSIKHDFYLHNFGHFTSHNLQMMPTITRKKRNITPGAKNAPARRSNKSKMETSPPPLTISNEKVSTFSVPTPKIALVTPPPPYDPIKDAIAQYVKYVSAEFQGVTKHTEAHDCKRNAHLTEFIKVISESCCLPDYLKERVTGPDDGLRTAPRL